MRAAGEAQARRARRRPMSGAADERLGVALRQFVEAAA
jgi:hypothetical protein